ncbi:MAG: hypothetical protein COW67_10945 [Flavobacteriales bacterium CG18_big_fil_WC_8_21_14_2_50_32_9]|nr:MAG: hypothetical protein COW67_10945 [Flavobacteriales bacterium CG18_big_fil_WC_8_21_14_2_50_32_9]PJC62436.1 MAG: DUF2520 domain-containing protein [Flavobacteriales bacterium CG_4_9_14_0_2_um_filter_32_27]
MKKITIIGSGNVATILSKVFVNKGFSINQVFSKSKINAEILIEKLAANQQIKITDNIAEIDDTSDIYIVCVKDDAIATVVNQILFKDKLIVHTSGSVDITVFNGFNQFGVFYPLQTFSKDKDTDVANVPFCIEGNTNQTTQLLIDLASSISKKVYEINSEQRKTLHLAAVFACNFTNYMYSIAEEITTKNNINFEVLKPLIQETAKKIEFQSPKEAQTGPAKRKDQQTINKHLAMLENNPNKELYKLITDLIQK